MSWLGDSSTLRGPGGPGGPGGRSDPTRSARSSASSARSGWRNQWSLKKSQNTQRITTIAFWALVLLSFQSFAVSFRQHQDLLDFFLPWARWVYATLLKIQLQKSDTWRKKYQKISKMSQSQHKPAVSNYRCGNCCPSRPLLQQKITPANSNGPLWLVVTCLSLCLSMTQLIQLIHYLSVLVLIILELPTPPNKQKTLEICFLWKTKCGQNHELKLERMEGMDC